MTEISLNLPRDISNSLADLAKTSGQSVADLALNILRDYIEQETALAAQIKLALDEADQAEFATDDQAAAMRARRWKRNAS